MVHPEGMKHKILCKLVKLLITLYFRGCHIQNCSYRTDNSSSPKGYESEYENVSGISAVTSPRKQTALQQPVTGNHRKMYVVIIANYFEFHRLTVLNFVIGMNAACHHQDLAIVQVMVPWEVINPTQHLWILVFLKILR